MHIIIIDIYELALKPLGLTQTGIKTLGTQPLSVETL
jgi:hypothetical protein